MTMQDAVETGLTQMVNVLENGSDVAGTQLNCVNEETLAVINDADIIISKGQGNFETLNGCGLNIYYLFLCKCDCRNKDSRCKQYKSFHIHCI